MPFQLSTNDGLIRIRLYDVLSPGDLIGLADAVLAAEAGPVAPDRVTDMSGVRRFEVGYADFFSIAARRRGSQLPNTIKSAIVVGNPTQFGMARMFQTLNDHPQVTVEIFDDEAAALRWLATPDDQPG
jgi:hypothetical protein